MKLFDFPVTRLVGAALFLNLSAVPAQAALSLADARTLAESRAPMLAARRAAVDAARALTTSAAELPDPRISAGVDSASSVCTSVASAAPSATN